MLLDDLKKTYYDLKTEFDKLNDNIDLDKLTKQVKNLEQLTMAPDFWSDTTKAQAIIAEINEANELIGNYKKVKDIFETIELTITLAEEGEPINEVETKQLIADFSKLVGELTLKVLLNEEYDKFNAIIEFHPGAGGTESLECI
jgi:peptide chain release factor 2